MDSIISSKPLVSISCITYNHVNYIEKALNGFLMQKTNFKFEVLIHDDASTDGTEEIIRDFEKRHPSIIKALYEETNQWVKGRKGSAVFNYPRAKGKYIALCEGDDYWTDPLKLQKQVDFLEANTDVNICFTRANVLRENTLSLHEIPEPFNSIPFKYIELLRHHNFIATASVMYRKPNPFIIPDWFLKVPFGDLGLYKIAAEDKNIQCIDTVMCVYRIHDSGVYSGLNPVNAKKNYATFYKLILPELTAKEKEIVVSKIKMVNYTISKLKFPKKPWLQKMYNMYLRLKV